MMEYSFYYDQKAHILYIYENGNLIKSYTEVYSSEEAEELYQRFLDEESIVIPEGLCRT